MLRKEWQRRLLLAGWLGCMASFLGYQAVPAPYVCAETKTIAAEGIYLLQNPEDKVQTAKEQARQEAMRNALEQAGVYVSSYAAAHNLQLTEDEIETRASGILHVESEQYKTSIDNGVVAFHCHLAVQVDLDNIMTAQPNTQLIAYVAGHKQQELKRELEQKQALLAVQQKQLERVSRKSYEQDITPELVQKFQSLDARMAQTQKQLQQSLTPRHEAANVLAKDGKNLAALYQLARAPVDDTAEAKAACLLVKRQLWDLLHETFTEDEYYALVIPQTTPGHLLAVDLTGSHLVAMRQVLSLATNPGQSSWTKSFLRQDMQDKDGQTVTLAIRPYDLTPASLAKAHQVLDRYQQYLTYQQTQEKEQVKV